MNTAAFTAEAAHLVRETDAARDAELTALIAVYCSTPAIPQQRAA